MSTIVSFAGSSYTLAAPGETGWGANVTAFLTAVAAYTINKAGGTQTLTAQLNLGAAFGVTAGNFTSAAANPATAGAVRLATGDLVEWRDPANSTNDTLGLDADEYLVFTRQGIALLVNGHPQSRYTTAAAPTLALSATTIVNFATQDYDGVSGCVTTGAAWKFTVPTRKAGRYIVSAMITPNAAMAATAGSALSVFKSGVEVARLWKWSVAAANNGSIGGHTILNLAAGEYVDIRFINATASNVVLTASALENYVSITKLIV